MSGEARLDFPDSLSFWLLTTSDTTAHLTTVFLIFAIHPLFSNTLSNSQTLTLYESLSRTSHRLALDTIISHIDRIR